MQVKVGYTTYQVTQITQKLPESIKQTKLSRMALGYKVFFLQWQWEWTDVNEISGLLGLLIGIHEEIWFNTKTYEYWKSNELEAWPFKCSFCRAHLSKVTSSLKQKCTQTPTSFLSTVFMLFHMVRSILFRVLALKTFRLEVSDWLMKNFDQWKSGFST